MGEQYFLFHFTPNGDDDNIGCYVCKNEYEVREYLKPEEGEDPGASNWFGEYHFVKKFDELDKRIKDIDTTNLLLVKGRVIVPKPKQVITDYDFE